MKSFLKYLLFPLVVVAVQAGDWPQWRGVSRDGMTVDEKPLARLPVKAQTIWQVPVGKGQGGLVLADGKLLVLQETNVGGKPMETAVLINAANGKVTIGAGGLGGPPQDTMGARLDSSQAGSVNTIASYTISHKLEIL